MSLLTFRTRLSSTTLVPLCVAVLFLAGTVGFTASAQAADLSDREVGRALVKDLTTALRAKQVDEIQSHVVRIADTYSVIESATVRARLMKALGKASRFKDEGVRRAALRALAGTGDAAAWKYVAPFLKQPDRTARPAFFEEAVVAAEALRADGSVNGLLDLVKKSKHAGVAGRAMEALSVFGQSKLRVKILGTIIDTTRKNEALAGAMVETANTLTGQDIDTASEWFVVWRNHRSAPVTLFENPGGA